MLTVLDYVLMVDWFRNLVMFFMFLLVSCDWHFVNNVWLDMSDFMTNDMWLNFSMVVLLTLMLFLMVLWDRSENKWLINYLIGSMMNIMLLHDCWL